MLQATISATQAEDVTDTIPALVNSVSRRLGEFGLMLHETATNITEVTGESERQVGQFKTLRNSADVMVEANRKIDATSGIAQETAKSGQAELSDCRSAIAEAMKRVSLLVDTTRTIEQRLSEVENASRSRRGLKGNREDRPANQPSRAQCNYRGLARWRGGPWLCGGSGRGQDTFGPDSRSYVAYPLHRRQFVLADQATDRRFHPEHFRRARNL